MLAHHYYNMWIACRRTFWRKFASMTSRRSRFSTWHHCNFGATSLCLASSIAQFWAKVRYISSNGSSEKKPDTDEARAEKLTNSEFMNIEMGSN